MFLYQFDTINYIILVFGFNKVLKNVPEGNDLVKSNKNKLKKHLLMI